MCTLKQALAAALALNRPELGYKATARAVGLPKSATRYALQAIHGGHVAAVALGVIRDQRVIGILNALPAAVAKTISRIETRLKRHLTRNRAREIVWHYWMASLMREISRMPSLKDSALRRNGLLIEVMR